MINRFIALIKNGLRHSKLDFYKSLRNSLYTRKPALNEIFDDLTDNYCEGEKLLGKDIYLGCIYIFQYSQKNPSTYGKVKFIDPAPMVLITQQSDKYIRGINLNLCTPALRTLILNIITNLDDEFFNGGFVEMCENGEKPLSNTVLSFMDKNGEDDIINALTRHFDDIDYRTVFRTYSKENIQRIRFVEYYIWPYIPGLEFTGIPIEVMKQYWKLSGISKIQL